MVSLRSDTKMRTFDVPCGDVRLTLAVYGIQDGVTRFASVVDGRIDEYTISFEYRPDATAYVDCFFPKTLSPNAKGSDVLRSIHRVLSQYHFVERGCTEDLVCFLHDTSTPPHMPTVSMRGLNAILCRPSFYERLGYTAVTASADEPFTAEVLAAAYLLLLHDSTVGIRELERITQPYSQPTLLRLKL